VNTEVGSRAVCEAIETAPTLTTVDVANILRALLRRLAVTRLQQQGRAECDKVLTTAHSAILTIWLRDEQ
jgi:uncharacterized membrane protein